ncbi:MAG: DUF2845 domain-containing protein [Pseudomonadota bacterium]|nr:DUF2845 domain-containing protein [Pseudomonadota bacterium]
MKKIMVVAAVTVVLWLTAQVAAAQGMHCGSKIVTTGDHKYEILAACGQPASREIVGVDNKHVGEYRIVEEWLYIIEKYGHKQMYLLEFDGDGRAQEIKWLGEQK